MLFLALDSPSTATVRAQSACQPAEAPKSNESYPRSSERIGMDPNGSSWSRTFRCFFPWTEFAICRNLKIAPSSKNTHAAIGAPKTHFIGSWTRFWQRTVRSSDRCRLDCFLSARFVYNSPLTCSRWIEAIAKNESSIREHSGAFSVSVCSEMFGGCR